MSISISDFSYQLPGGCIASTPAIPRDHCKLLTLNRNTGELTDTIFHNLENILTPQDVLVLNQTKVFPARLFGTKSTGGKTEVILLSQITTDSWHCIGKNLHLHTKIIFSASLSGVITHIDLTGECTIQFNLSAQALLQELDTLGHTPIPPYIASSLDEQTLRREYQTVYAQSSGSAAAPTAGLHFTLPLLDKLTQKGVQIEYLTLHVGLGTFQNLRPENLASKTLHSEWYDLPTEVAERLNHSKSQGKRIIAVGTTTTRVLESCAGTSLVPGSSFTDIFIYPPYKFKFVDSLITNFHLPESSLLMLVSAFVSSPNTLHPFTNFSNSSLGSSYQHAIDGNYRFFSFGDAMWIY